MSVGTSELKETASQVLLLPTRKVKCYGESKGGRKGGYVGAAADGRGSAALHQGEVWLCWLPMAFLPPGEMTFPEMKSEQAE